MTRSPDAGQTITHQGDCILFGMCRLFSLHALGLPNSGSAIDNAKDQGRIPRRLKSNKKCKLICSESQYLNLDPIFLYPSAVPPSLLRSVSPRHLSVLLSDTQAVATGPVTGSMSHLPFAFARVSIFPLHKTLLCFLLPA